MSHSELDKVIFASAREWRRVRAMIAADVRHGHDGRAQEYRELLALMKQPGLLRALVSYQPGIFELGTEHADWFYEAADRWGALFAPGAFREVSP